MYPGPGLGDRLVLVVECCKRRCRQPSFHVSTSIQSPIGGRDLVGKTLAQDCTQSKNVLVPRVKLLPQSTSDIASTYEAESAQVLARFIGPSKALHLDRAGFRPNIPVKGSDYPLGISILVLILVMDT